MSLRDAMAMSVYLPDDYSVKWGEALIGEQAPNSVEPASVHIDWWMRVEAAYRYRMSDALLKAREKGKRHLQKKYLKDWEVGELDTNLIRGHYTNKIIPITESVNAGSMVPGVRRVVLDCKDFQEAKRKSREAFDEMDANCNTCVKLQRTPSPKCKFGWLDGECSETGTILRFHPDDCMNMPCWKSRTITWR